MKALDIEDNIETNFVIIKFIIATDADQDGLHIRNLFTYLFF